MFFVGGKRKISRRPKFVDKSCLSLQFPMFSRILGKLRWNENFLGHNMVRRFVSCPFVWLWLMMKIDEIFWFWFRPFNCLKLYSEKFSLNFSVENWKFPSQKSIWSTMHFQHIFSFSFTKALNAYTKSQISEITFKKFP